MNKQLRMAMILGALFALLGVGAALAQTAPNGSIRGTVYLDKNGDGKCVGTGDPIQAGVPIEFVSDDGKWSTYLQSGANGTYGLVAAAYGTWTVSARPNANDFVVISKPTLSVFIGSEQPLALNIDFCVQTKGGPVTGGSTTTTLLPTSGTAANNIGFLAAGLSGLLLVGLGAVVVRRR